VGITLLHSFRAVWRSEWQIPQNRISSCTSCAVGSRRSIVVATNGDNTNLVIGQVVQKRFGVGCVVVRILDPARADFYAARGMQVVCPTKTAITALGATVRRTTAALTA